MRKFLKILCSLLLAVSLLPLPVHAAGSGAKTMTRAEYDANPVAGAAKIRDGYTVVNAAA